MKTETKILIVAIIMILSVGPLDFFFTAAPKALPLPNATNTTTSYSLSGNITGTIMDIKPYIYYVGVADFNNEAYVSSVITSISGIENYSVKVTLNPNGNGYQYTIIIPLNDTTQIKELGFRLALKFSTIFVYQATPLPFIDGTVSFPPQFQISTDQGILNLSSKANLSVDAVMLYSEKQDSFAIFKCDSMVISLNYSVLRPPTFCEDTQLIDTTSLSRQNIFQYGLDIYDLMAIQQFNKTLNLDVQSITGIELSGRFKLSNFSAFSVQDLENKSNSSLLLNYDNDSFTSGNFTAQAAYVSNDNIESIKSLLEQNKFTTDKEYKIANVVLPNNVTYDGKTYDLYGLNPPSVKIAVSDGLGPHEFLVSFAEIYDEIINVNIERVNLS